MPITLRNIEDSLVFKMGFRRGFENRFNQMMQEAAENDAEIDEVFTLSRFFELMKANGLTKKQMAKILWLSDSEAEAFPELTE